MKNNKVREVRREIGMPLSELARRTGTSRETMTKIELSGRVPNGMLLLAISNVLKIDPRELFFASDVNHDKRINGG